MKVTSSGGSFEAAWARAPSMVLGSLPLIFVVLSTQMAVGAASMAVMLAAFRSDNSTDALMCGLT